jgi:MFS family permease
MPGTSMLTRSKTARRGGQRSPIGTTALTNLQFLLLFAAMLVAAAGNTALQSVMPAMGREIGIGDFWVAVAYTSSAILWVLFAGFWAEKSDRHGRKRLMMLGVGGFVASMLLCGLVLRAGLSRALPGVTTFILFAVARSIYGTLGCATPSATQAYLASRTRRSGRVAALSSLSSSFGLGTILGPAMAPLFVLPFVGLPGPLFAFALIALCVFAAIWRWLPDDSRDLVREGRGAAMSYPSLATPTTGASVVAATSQQAARTKWRDPRIRQWIVAGVVSGHAQAATLTALGFYIIDRLHLPPSGSEMPISIVMMAGASATLAAQWGVIPRLGLNARTMIISGALIAAAGCIALVVAQNLYGLVIGFALSSLGFGFTRPGFTGGASLAVPMAEQGGVAGAITAANGIAYVAAPSIGMALYGLEPGLPFAAAAVMLIGLAIWGRSSLTV